MKNNENETGTQIDYNIAFTLANQQLYITVLEKDLKNVMDLIAANFGKRFKLSIIGKNNRFLTIDMQYVLAYEVSPTYLAYGFALDESSVVYSKDDAVPTEGESRLSQADLDAKAQAEADGKVYNPKGGIISGPRTAK